MANTPYPNYVLQNKFEDQFNSYLDLMQFCTVDPTLVGEPGMIKKIRVYTATDNKTQTLKKVKETQKLSRYHTQILTMKLNYYKTDLSGLMKRK